MTHSGFKNRFERLIIALFLILFIPTEALSLSSTNVAINQTVYSDLDILYSYGLISDYIKGYRPYSRNQVALYLIEARQNLDKVSISSEQMEFLQASLESLEADFKYEIDFHTHRANWKSTAFNLAKTIQAELGYRHDNPRPTPNQNQGASAAVISPQTSYKNGRHYIDDGLTTNLSALSTANLSRFVSISLMPLVEIGLKDNSQFRFNLETVNFKFNLANISLQIGRDEVARHFGLYGGLTHTNNARNFDKIELSNDIPFKMPWILKHLGSHKLSAYIAHLGPENLFDNVYITGWSWHLLPLDWLEFGASHFVILGGDQLPSTSILDGVEQFFGVLPGGSSIRPGDSVFEFSTRVAIPQLRYSELYFDFAFDDLNSEPDIFFLHDSAYLAGLYIPRLDRLGKLNLRLEFQSNSERMYKHDTYRTGKTLNNNSFGSHLGAGTYGLLLSSMYTINSRWRVGAAFNLEQYSGDDYTASFSGTDIIGINNSLDRPEEFRFRTTLNALYNAKTFSINPSLSYETVKNFAFTQGDSRHNVFMLVKASYFWSK